MADLVLNVLLLIYLTIVARVLMVLRYREKLLHQVDRWATDDIDRGLDWQWRFDYLRQQTPSWWYIIIGFWKRPSSYWPNQKFIKRQPDSKWRPV